MKVAVVGATGMVGDPSGRSAERQLLSAEQIQANIDGELATEPLQQYGFRRTLFNIGGQLDFRLVLFSNLSSTFSIGFARAVEEDIKATDEFMISLKIM